MIEKRKLSSIITVIVFIQAFLFGGLFLFMQINKWRIYHEYYSLLTVIIRVAIIGLFILSCMASLVYFVSYLAKRKKIYAGIPLVINILVIIIVVFFFNENRLREYNFKKYHAEREQIVSMIANKQLKPDETGKVELPDKLQNEEMARGGFVRLLLYKDRMGVYFCISEGLSRGYIFITDEIYSPSDEQPNISVLEQYDEGWEFCSIYYKTIMD